MSELPDTPRRVAVINDTSAYVGPHLARSLALKRHDLVLGDASPDLVAELTALGAKVVAVTDARDSTKPKASARLVDAAMTTFGRIDSATAATGRVVTGRFLKSTIEDLHAVTKGCIDAPYHFLRAVIPVMVEQKDGQALLITSAAGARRRTSRGWGCRSRGSGARAWRGAGFRRRGPCPSVRPVVGR